MENKITRKQYKVLKRIIKHKGKPESFYIKRYKCKDLFDSLVESSLAGYKIIGYSSTRSSSVVFGAFPECSDEWVITETGIETVNLYEDYLYKIKSDRVFSVVMAIVGIVLSVAATLIVNALSA